MSISKIKLLIVCYVPEIAIKDNMSIIANKVKDAFISAGKTKNKQLDVTIITRIDRTAVISNMKNIAKYLETPNNKGIIYYFGHGDQVTDYNGDESDGKDEKWTTQSILDDEITSIFANIHNNSYLYLFSDSCSSGSMIDDNNHKNWITISSSMDHQDSAAMSDGGMFTMFGLIPALQTLTSFRPTDIYNFITKNIDMPTQYSVIRFGKLGVEKIDMFD